LFVIRRAELGIEIAERGAHIAAQTVGFLRRSHLRRVEGLARGLGHARNALQGRPLLHRLSLPDRQSKLLQGVDELFHRRRYRPAGPESRRRLLLAL
jgi:hypothetical protein